MSIDRLRESNSIDSFFLSTAYSAEELVSKANRFLLAFDEEAARRFLKAAHYTDERVRIHLENHMPCVERTPPTTSHCRLKKGAGRGVAKQTAGGVYGRYPTRLRVKLVMDYFASLRLKEERVLRNGKRLQPSTGPEIPDSEEIFLAL